MWNTQALAAALLVLACAGGARADYASIRYQNPGSAVYEWLDIEVDGSLYATVVSGCPPVPALCNAAIDLGQGLHQVRARAWVGRQVSAYSNVVPYQGVPEPPRGFGLALAGLTLALLARGR